MTHPTPPDIFVRTAHPADAAAIAALAGELGYPSRLDQIKSRLQHLCEEKGNWVAVAEIQGRVVGWIHLFAAYRVESEPFAEIGGLVVEQSSRGQGVGRRLAAAAAAWATERGFAELRVRTNVIRSGTHRFYARVGFDSLKAQTVFAKKV
jgi:GNAT superfamily N-acetyltransferase